MPTDRAIPKTIDEIERITELRVKQNLEKAKAQSKKKIP